MNGTSRRAFVFGPETMFVDTAKSSAGMLVLGGTREERLHKVILPNLSGRSFILYDPDGSECAELSESLISEGWNTVRIENPASLVKRTLCEMFGEKTVMFICVKNRKEALSVYRAIDAMIYEAFIVCFGSQNGWSSQCGLDIVFDGFNSLALSEDAGKNPVTRLIRRCGLWSGSVMISLDAMEEVYAYGGGAELDILANCPVKVCFKTDEERANRYFSKWHCAEEKKGMLGRKKTVPGGDAVPGNLNDGEAILLLPDSPYARIVRV